MQRRSVPGAAPGQRIGLLGGSFNPPHGGHLHISRLALWRLGLDAVWWLVAPQNPLKPSSGMAPLAECLEAARACAAADRDIVATDIETHLGTRYTADTIAALRRRFPRLHFVWLMGGDNLAQFPYWQRWQQIFRTVPIAVFARPGSSVKALAGAAAHRFARARIPASQARRLALLPPPAWAFFHGRLDPRSSTRIRAARDLTTLMEIKPAVLGETATVTAFPPRLPVIGDAGDGVRDLLRRIVGSLEDGKAEGIVTIDLAGKTSIADYMVIATGRSARQVLALTDHLEQVLPRRVAIEGKTQADWVLIDAGDVIVHIFRPEIRAYYNLEKMWGADQPESEAAALQ